MGRGISTPTNTIQTAYRDIAHFGYEWNEETEVYEGEFDQCMCDIEWEDLTYWIIESAQQKWKSFEDVSSDNRWAGSEDRILLENNFAQIGISEYGGGACIWLRSRVDDHDTYYAENQRHANKSDNFCNLISNNFRKMFAEFVKVGSFSNGESVYEKI